MGKLISMSQWVPEVVNTPEENDLLVAGVAAELLRVPEVGAQTVLIGGDTLVFGAVDDDGRMCVYECSIRRANVTEVDGLKPTIEPAQVAPSSMN